MLESYHEEIIRKKRAARIFWVIVFVFAWLLYFFFQGYYPDIQFRLANIGSGTVSGEERRLTIKSFGIVNVKTVPEGLDLRLNTTPYGNNEKKMVDYGDYTFIVSGEGYLPGKMNFSIDNERPYYIDLLTIIPKPSYLPYSRKFDQIARIGENLWTLQDASGMTLFEGSFDTGMLISPKRFAHIGEGYFLSGNTIMSYDVTEHRWVSEKDEEWGMFAKRCPSITVKNALLFCQKTGEAMLPSGKTLTGILNIGNNYLTTKTALIIIENNRVKKTLSLSGVTNDASDFVSIEDIWYFSQGGKLLPIGTGSRISTSLESIKYMEWVDGELLLFGKRGKDTFLSFFDVDAPEKSRTIPFPDISLEAIRIWKTAGNLWIKTEGALLFIYHGSDEIHWIVDGAILTVGDDIALYEKDDKVWKADWKEITK